MPKPKTCSQCGAERTGKFCGGCGFEEKRGGAHRGAGRPVNEADEEDVKVGKGFATRVFARIHELALKFDVDKTDPDLGSQDEKKCQAAEKRIADRLAKAPFIKTAEDYALNILGLTGPVSREMFKLLLAYQLGKPVQPVMTADTRETAPELDFGNLIMPTQASNPKPGTARKPN